MTFGLRRFYLFASRGEYGAKNTTPIWLWYFLYLC